MILKFKFIVSILIVFNSTLVLGLELIDSNFWIEGRAGQRIQKDDFEETASVQELRFQANAAFEIGEGEIYAKADLLYDTIEESQSVDLEQGRGWLDIRELNYSNSVAENLDIKVGRQILSWGTGDLVFLNDLFPKDFNFFAGREIEYVRAASDALKLSFYSNFFEVDLVYTPQFDADRFIDGRRLSYVNTRTSQRVGRNQIIDFEERNEFFEDDELALRLSKNYLDMTWALYAYSGFWKSPLSINTQTQKASFSRLDSYGASARGLIGKGVFNFELSYYDSVDDRPGTDDFTPNSEVKTLLGYEHELGRNWTGSVQYYATSMLDYDEYAVSLKSGVVKLAKENHVATFRISKTFFEQTLRMTLFNYYSLNQKDLFLRFVAKYQIDDYWSSEAGVHVFNGPIETMFGALQNNSNVFLSLRRAL